MVIFLHNFAQNPVQEKKLDKDKNDFKLNFWSYFSDQVILRERDELSLDFKISNFK